MNLEGERDYSAVRTPVLDFLIQHELFRIELAERFKGSGKVSRRGERNIEKTKATYRARRRANWEPIFKKLGWRAGTSAIAAQVARSSMSVHGSMTLLLKDGFVVKDGTIPHPGNGRDQTIWKWVEHA